MVYNVYNYLTTCTNVIGELMVLAIFLYEQFLHHTLVSKHAVFEHSATCLSVTFKLFYSDRFRLRWYDTLGEFHGPLSRVRFVSFLLNVPVNNFSAMSGRSYRFMGITSTFGK